MNNKKDALMTVPAPATIYCQLEKFAHICKLITLVLFHAYKEK